MEKTILEERKKTIYQFICDEFYVPMKAKEMAVVLSVPKSQRSELQEVKYCSCTKITKINTRDGYFQRELWKQEKNIRIQR